MQAPEYSIKVTTDGCKIISSGVVHLVQQKVKFELANLTIEFQFKSDSGESRFEGMMENDGLLINLYNSKSSLGEGKLDPVGIGKLDGKDLFVTWYVNTIKNDLRQFNYTFMLKEN